MKISIKTIIIVAVLGAAISLASIIAAFYVHLSGMPDETVEESTPSQMSDLSEDFNVSTTSSPDTDFDEAESDTESDESSSFTESEQEISVVVTVEATESTIPETTEPETTYIETTTEITTEPIPDTTEETTEIFIETIPDTTKEVIETEPETTAHTHAYSAWKVKNKPTCEKDGLNYRNCECGEIEYLTVSASGHKSKKLTAVAATCLSEGLIEGSVCTICNKVLKKQTKIPMTDCKYKGVICVYCGKVDESAISLSAPFAGLYKADSLECIYSVSADAKTPPASLTKMITACVAIKYMPLDHVITVGSEQDLVPRGSSLCYIYKGNKIELYDLLTGMLLCSGNDAAYAVAVNVARYAAKDQSMSNKAAITYFCGLMNDYAKDIGAKSTCFKTPDGFDSEGQYSTVNDLAIITSHAMSNKTISKIVSIHYIKVVFESGQLAKWTNTNELINPNSDYYTECVTGFKTGGTVNAGKCLSATFEVDGVKYIAIVLGCEDNDARYENILELIKIIQ